MRFRLAFEFPGDAEAVAFERLIEMKPPYRWRVKSEKSGTWVTAYTTDSRVADMLGDDAEALGGEFHLSESLRYSYQSSRSGRQLDEVFPFVAAAAGGAVAAHQGTPKWAKDWEEREWKKIKREGECKRKGGWWFLGRCWGGEKDKPGRRKPPLQKVTRAQLAKRLSR